MVFSHVGNAWPLWSHVSISKFQQLSKRISYSNSPLVSAEFGDFTAGVHDARFVSEFRFVSGQTEAFESAVAHHFATLR